MSVAMSSTIAITFISIIIMTKTTRLTRAAVDAQVRWSLPGARLSNQTRDMCHILLMADRTPGFTRFREDVLNYLKFAVVIHTLMVADKAFVNPATGFQACLLWFVDDSTNFIT